MKLIKVTCPDCHGDGETCDLFVSADGKGAGYENFERCRRCGGDGIVDKAVLD